MKGDFSRITFDRRKHYTGVLIQQGRVLTDADANEEQAIRQYRDETEARDVIGPTGTPKENPGFGIAVQATGGVDRIAIAPGRYYVDGILCENEARVTEDRQPDLPPANPGSVAPSIRDLLTAAGATAGLVYLDAWKRPVTAMEDPDIKEVALGEADTSARLRTVWQVRVLPLRTPGATCVSNLPEWNALISPRDARLRAHTGTGSPPPSDTLCILPPAAGYHRLENQLYRVEVHAKGGMNAATFKWSRENGSVTARILERVGANAVRVAGLSRDDKLGFRNGDCVEVIDDARELRGEPGQLFTITINARGDLVTCSGNVSPLGPNPRLRRWDSPASPPAVTSAFLPLEGGVEVRFSGTDFRTGDYWLIPARTHVGDILWPEDASGNPLDKPRDGITHHYARLALVRIAAGRLVVEADCRELFPSLTNIAASDISFDNRVCDLEGATTVQQALDGLCRRKEGTCTVSVFRGDDVAAVLAGLSPNQDACICFETGTFTLPRTVVLANLGHLKITGCGKGTRLVASTAEAALLFRDCKSVTVRDLYAESGALGSGKRGPHHRLKGTLTFENCGEVSVEEAELKCAAGKSPSATCVTIGSTEEFAALPNARGLASVRRCRLSVGHQQAGILLVNATRARVEDNLIQVIPKPNSLRFTDLLRDKRQRSQHKRLLVSEIRETRTRKPVNTDGGTDRPTDVRVEREARNLVTLSSGNVSVQFRTDPDLLRSGVWDRVFSSRTLGPKGIEASRQLIAYVNEIADRVLENQGRLENLEGFREWFARLAEGDTSVAYQGVVVAGVEAGDVRIAGNTIRGVLQGIHVGLSRGNAAPGRRDLSQTVLIEGNTVDVILPPNALRARHGIFVGNCDSMAIENNIVTLDRLQAQNRVPVDGIRVYGQLGKRMIVRQNHMKIGREKTRGFTRGILIHPLNDFPRPLWLVSDNVAGVTVELEPGRVNRVRGLDTNFA